MPGAEQVDHVCTAVSASLDVFERAAAAGAQMLVVHHGLFWDGSPRRIGMLERRRLEALFANDLSLVAYHLPLDGHHELGNNAVLAALLGLEEHEPFGELPRAAARPLGLAAGAARRRRAGGAARRRRSDRGRWCSVAAPTRCERWASSRARPAGRCGAAAELGLDCFITGEPEEDLPYLAAELGVNVIAAGHHATETVGVQAVGGAPGAGVRRRATSYLAVENPV